MAWQQTLEAALRHPFPRVTPAFLCILEMYSKLYIVKNAQATEARDRPSCRSCSVPSS